MAQQIINIGTIANDGTGTPLRDSFDICNNNFTELYARVYGTELNFWTEPALQTNTTTTPVDVLNETTSALSVGTHEITISGTVSCDSTNSDGIVYATFDGTPLTGTTGNNEIYRLEFKDSRGDNPPGAGTAQKQPFTLTYPVQVTVAGAKSIIIQTASETGGVEMNIWNLYVKTIRIS